jgi:RNA polymerase sigma factor (sigma-70 family)
MDEPGDGQKSVKYSEALASNRLGRCRMCDGSLERYQRDRDVKTLQRIMEENRALVASVARRYLRDPHDVDDIVQETFLKFAGRAGSLSGSMPAWLAMTAQSCSVDLIRRSVRERRRRQGLSHMGAAKQTEFAVSCEAVRARLHDGMLALEPAARELLIERFVRHTPLRVLAGAQNVSVATMSRRVAEAIRELAMILREMGVPTADEQVVAAQFGSPAEILNLSGLHVAGLRFAPDWRAASLSPWGDAALGVPFDGWSRPLRVGVVLSYSSATTRRVNGTFTPPGLQLNLTLQMVHPGLQFVAVIEPGTDEKGLVEQSLRDYSLLGGLVSADDSSALRTLDVILLGNYTHRMPTIISAALVDAVRGGVGLLNELWSGWFDGPNDDANLRSLLLAESAVYAYHTPGKCGLHRPATVLREHAVLPGLKAGTRLSVEGCGPAYRPMPSAQVLIAKDQRLAVGEHHMPNVGTLPMPAYTVGELGKGRVAVVQNWPHWGRREKFESLFDLSFEQYVLNLLNWLAEPRRQAE